MAKPIQATHKFNEVFQHDGVNFICLVPVQLMTHGMFGKGTAFGDGMVIGPQKTLKDVVGHDIVASTKEDGSLHVHDFIAPGGKPVAVKTAKKAGTKNPAANKVVKAKRSSAPKKKVAKKRK